MTIPIRRKPIFHRMYYIVRNNHEEGCISPLQRPHYFTSSYTHNTFEKSDYCIVLQKINCTRQFESQLSLRSLASLFPIKEDIFLPLRLSCKESSTFLTKPLFPQEREDVTALRCSEPLRYKVGGPIKGLAMLCGMGPPGEKTKYLERQVINGKSPY